MVVCEYEDGRCGIGVAVERSCSVTPITTVESPTVRSGTKCIAADANDNPDEHSSRRRSSTSTSDKMPKLVENEPASPHPEQQH